MVIWSYFHNPSPNFIRHIKLQVVVEIKKSQQIWSTVIYISWCENLENKNPENHRGNPTDLHGVQASPVADVQVSFQDKDMFFQRSGKIRESCKHTHFAKKEQTHHQSSPTPPRKNTHVSNHWVPLPKAWLTSRKHRCTYRTHRLRR